MWHYCQMSFHPNDQAPDSAGYAPRSSGQGFQVARSAWRAAGSGKLGAVVLAAALLTSACALPASNAAGPGGQAANAPTAAAAAVGKSPQKPLDPLAPTTHVPVVRGAKKPQPSINAGNGRFSAAAPVRYSDGVAISVDRVTPRVEKGNGPGVFPNRPYVALSFSIVNGSTHSIDLNQVVVATSYGSPARSASPVYEDSTARDFAGTLQPGGSATATYLFAVPTEKRSSVTTTVDFDDRHFAAKFNGAAG